MKYKHWRLAPARGEHRDALERGGLSPLLSAVLAARGIHDPRQARALLSGSEDTLHAPLEMKDMEDRKSVV